MSQIKFNQDGSINFGDYTLTFTSEGFEFDGEILANSYATTPLGVIQGSTSGYTSGGNPGNLNIIDKFPFATDANATDVGNLTQVRFAIAGQSSTASGYNSGGFSPPAVNTIDKFPFASDANATDVGNLTQGRYGPAGQQV